MKKILATVVAVMMFGCIIPASLAEDIWLADSEVAAEQAVMAEAPAAVAPAAEVLVVVTPAETSPVVVMPAEVTSAAEELVFDAPVTEEPVVDAPVTEEPVVDVPVAEEPAADAPVAEEPVTDTPAAEETVVDAPVAEEPVQEAVPEEAPVQDEEPVRVVDAEPVLESEPIMFSGKLKAKLASHGEITIGRKVVLKAYVNNANMAYKVQWQSLPKEDLNTWKESWTKISFGEKLIFEATDASDDYYYRAVLTAEDGTVMISGLISFEVVPAKEVPGEAPAAEEIPAGEPVTVEPAVGEVPAVETVAEEQELPEDEDATGDEQAVEEIPAEETEIIEDYETPLGLQKTETLYAIESADVRLEADGLSAVFASLEKGTSVTAMGQVGNWTRVLMGDRIGYIYSKSLADAMPEDGDPAPEAPVAVDETERKMNVSVFSSRRTVMTEGEDVHLTSRVEGFEGLEVFYQWECDQGQGFRKVENANEDAYVFKASAESLSWSWRLTVYYR